MCKAIQHPCAVRKALHRTAIQLLVEEEAGFLPLGHIHPIVYPVLTNLNLGVKGLGEKTFYPLHALLESLLRIAPLVDSAYRKPLLRKNFEEYL